jgi:hypothetical protein
MRGPIVFISHFRIADGRLDAYLRLSRDVSRRLYAEKPRTDAFLTYLDQAGMRVSIVHVFRDADAMDLHSVGAEERSEAAMRYLEPEGWEIYGSASDAALETIRHAAVAAGVTLTVQRKLASGFRRTGDERGPFRDW